MPVEDTIKGFKAIIDGEMDEYPENAFFNVGTIEDVKEKQRLCSSKSIRKDKSYGNKYILSKGNSC